MVHKFTLEDFRKDASGQQIGEIVWDHAKDYPISVNFESVIDASKVFMEGGDLKFSLTAEQAEQYSLLYPAIGGTFKSEDVEELEDGTKLVKKFNLETIGLCVSPNRGLGIKNLKEQIHGVRTYREAVELTVDWWAKKSFKTPLNQNNGDNSPTGGMAFILMNTLSEKVQGEVTDEKEKKFREKLTEILMQEESGKFRRAMCSVDYDPNPPLYEACAFSGIQTFCLPVKSFTYINQDNEIEGRYTYGGDWFKI